MNARELRLGNLVYDPNHYGGGTEIQISKIDVTSETLSWWNDLQPVLITEQRLLDFGLKKNSKGEFETTNWSGLYLVYNLQWYLKRHTASGDVEICYGFKYIHELQNLFFALEGELIMS